MKNYGKRLFFIAATVGLVAIFSQLSCNVLNPSPVSLSPEYRAQVQTAVTVITELERRFKISVDPNDAIMAMTVARESLENILDADDMKGGQ